MHKLKILICDDVDHVRIGNESLAVRAAKGIFHPEIIEATSGEDAVQLVAEAKSAGSSIDLVLMDIDFSQAGRGANCLNGFEAAEKIHAILPDAVIAMVSSYGTDDNFQMTANTPYIDRFFRKGSFDPSELKDLCKYALVRALHGKNLLLPENRVVFTKSAVMNSYLSRIDRIFENESVFISGETGSGKGLTAYRLNANAKVFTDNLSRPLVNVNCGAIAPTLLMREMFGNVRGAFTGADRDKIGHFEAADGGDIFLDELQNASPEFQQALLGVLQTGEFVRVGDTKVIKVDVRVIAAFNEDPIEAIRSGKLREDLFARLQKNFVTIPALRDRKGDIPELINHFQTMYGKADKSFAPCAVEFLESLPWNTNVRGVQSAVEAAIRFSKLPTITVSALRDIPFIQEILKEMKTSNHEPSMVNAAGPWENQALQLFQAALDSGKNLHEIMTSFEKVVLEKEMKGDSAVLRVAKRLGIPESSLRRKLEQHELIPQKTTSKRSQPPETAKKTLEPLSPMI
jgi:DNA-binding NtrC family response regulator